MIMVIPVDGDDIEESKITTLEKANFFAFLELDTQSQIIKTVFENSIEDKMGEFDYLVVVDPTGDYDDFYDYNIEVLLSTPFSTIDTIHEDFIFKTLQEI